MSISQNYSPISPSLSLDFANVKKLDPRVTFARASTGAYYDGQTVSLAEQNLLLYSQEFDNAYWTKLGSIVTANSTTAPDGTVTAELLTEAASGTSSANVSVPNITCVAGENYSSSIYIKDNSSGRYFYISIITQNGSSVNYRRVVIDLSSGAITENKSGTNSGVAAPTLIASSVDTFGSWYRVNLSVTVNQTGVIGDINGLSDSGTPNNDVYGRVSYTLNSKSVYIWGAQLEQRDTVTAYQPTTTQAITNYVPTLLTAPANSARFDHDPVTGESLGLLIEEQRTNLLTYSEDFSNAAWTKSNATISANTIVAPDGTLTGDKLIVDSGAAAFPKTQQQTTLTIGVFYALSLYVKKGETRYLTFGFWYNQNNYAAIQFDFDTVSITRSAALGTSFAVTSSSATAVENGWYRLALVGTVGFTTSFPAVVGTNTVWSSGIPFADQTGDGYSGIYIWGAQLEAGSKETTYIPTVASQVTRSADSASMTGANFSSWYRQDQGSFYMEALAMQLNNENRVMSVTNNSTFNNRFSVYFAANTHLRASSSGGLNIDLDAGSFVANQFGKNAFAYSVNNYAVSLNGGTPTTSSANGTLPVVDRLYIGAGANGASQLDGHIRKLSYYPQRLTNAQLQALTS